MRKRLPAREKGHRSWTLRIVPRVRVKGEEHWGYCDHTAREIVLAKNTSKHGVDREIFMHEMIHKVCHWMDEEAVAYLAKELDDGLDLMDSMISL